MHRTIVILIVSVFVSACSSQGVAWVTEQVVRNVSANSDTGLEYDEAEIFPSPNQRLACQMDAQCKTPLTESEFKWLDTGEKLLVLYGEGQPVGHDASDESFVPLNTNYQNYLRRQREALEQERAWRSVVFRDPEFLTQPAPPE